MQGKRGVIMGLANDRSLAWGIAKQLAAQGAELAFTYQGEALERRVRPLATELGADFLIECDVSDMGALDAAFDTIAARWPTIDLSFMPSVFRTRTNCAGIITIPASTIS